MTFLILFPLSLSFSVPVKGLLPVTARIEKMDFLQPAYIGEVIKVKAKLAYTSPRSLMVVVDVTSENMLTGKERTTNTAMLWYVALDQNAEKAPGSGRVAPIPQLAANTPAQQELRTLGEQLYRRRKEGLARPEGHPHHHTLEDDDLLNPARYTKAEGGASPSASKTELIQIMMPSDCMKGGSVTGGKLVPSNIVKGGVIMKIMDEASSISAMRHCRTIVVTISLESMDFKHPAYNGNVVTAKSLLNFTSSKTMELEVTVEAEDLGTGKSVITNTSLFKFVSLDKNLKSGPVKPLHLETRDDVRRYLAGQRRYEEDKKARS